MAPSCLAGPLKSLLAGCGNYTDYCIVYGTYDLVFGYLGPLVYGEERASAEQPTARHQSEEDLSNLATAGAREEHDKQQGNKASSNQGSLKNDIPALSNT